MAKKNSLKVRKEHRREGPGKEAKLQREVIPGRGAHHRESAVLPSGGTGKRDKEETLFGWAEGSRAPSTKDSRAREDRQERGLVSSARLGQLSYTQSAAQRGASGETSRM